MWENPAVLKSLQRGMEQAATGKVRSLGSFAGYRDKD